MSNRNKIVSIFFGILFSGFPFCQTHQSLKDYIAYELEHHESRHEYDAKQVHQKARETRAGYLPSVNINGPLDDNLRVHEAVIPAWQFSPNEIRVAFTKQFSTNASAQLDQIVFDQTLLKGLVCFQLHLTVEPGAKSRTVSPG